MSTIDRRRAVRVVAPVAGLLAAGLLVWQGSYAAFSATTQNTADAWSTGTLALTNNGGTGTYAGSTSALFDGTTAGQPENNIKVGDGGQKCITVESSGSLAGTLKFYRGAITGNVLAPQIDVTVEAVPVAATDDIQADCTGFPTTGVTTLHNAVALTSLPSSYAGAAAGIAMSGGTERVAYRITWALASTGSGSGDAALMGQSSSADLDWEIQ